MIIPMSTKQARRARRAAGSPGRRSALTTADLVVLSLISERPMHGYELVKEYERQQVEDWALVSRPHVYYALQKLARRELIENTGDVDEPEPRGKAVYRITRTGREALSEALAYPTWATSRTPTSFNTWLGLSIHARPADKRRIVAARRTYLEEQIEREKRTLAEVEADTARRARIAEVMIGICIEQFQVELRSLKEVERILLGAEP
jgi:DNA-binding PadR family transcriptional regulator